MKNNEKILKSSKFLWAQKFIFKLLSKIQYGQLTIRDAKGIHVFKGSAGLTTHVVSIDIHNAKVYKKVLLNGSLAAGETYVEGYWDVDNLTKFIEIIIKNTEIFAKIDGNFAKFSNLMIRFAQTFKNNNISQIKKNIIAHYDLGNEFFSQFLDPTMMYSCAIFEPEDITLVKAAAQKIDIICQQLQLQASDHLLEIGTGWGGLAIYAAKQYGCKVTTTTISDKQYVYVRKQIESMGLQDKIELLNIDYRQLNGKYDKLVSIEMIEAIGYKNYDIFFRQCNNLIKQDGLFFLQTILINDQAYPRAKKEVDFIKKYIFPGGCLPSMGVISQSIAKNTPLQLIHLRDIGKHYSTTLHAWLNDFNAHVSQIKRQGFSEKFIRTWRYYFCYCAAGFNQTYITNIQALWRKNG
jgi:cyclopropane-fatty-acyl-phospholipid synthase